MSRGASRAQRTINTIDSSTPAMTNGKKIVTPSSAIVMPNVNSSGWMLGPGRGISSPAGGTSGSSGVIARSRDVDRRRDERHAEHEAAHGGDDESRSDVLASDVSVHFQSGILEVRVGDHRAEQQGEVGKREQVEAQRRAAVRAAVQQPGSADEGAAEHQRRGEVDDPEAAGAERQLGHGVEQERVQQDL